MRAWSSPDVPSLPVTGPVVRVHDTASDALVETRPEGPARMYVCGITPYDATHMGHAATYVAFDLLNRAWRNAGHEVTYVQNVTDVDDPLLERATKVNVDWAELAQRETQLFREDMEALRVLPPAHYTGAVESIPQVIELIQRLDEAGSVYRVDDDLYFSVTADDTFGAVSGLDRDTMLEIFPERGGDPDREGKKDPLDCLLWRAERPGEPAWDSPFGPGRPGLARRVLRDRARPPRVHVRRAGRRQRPGLPAPRDVAPVTRRSPTRASGSRAPTPTPGWSPTTARRCRSPRATWSSSPRCASATSTRWRSGWCCCATTTAATGSGPTTSSGTPSTPSPPGAAPSRSAPVRPALPYVERVLTALADDLDAPTAVAAVQDWVEATLGTTGLADTSDPDAAATIHRLLDAALGLSL